jgi:hypothetical protein
MAQAKMCGNRWLRQRFIVGVMLVDKGGKSVMGSRKRETGVENV